MKKFIQASIILMGLTAAPALTVAADTPAGSSGNQLGNQLASQNQVPWYGKPAASVQPVEGTKTKEGTILALQTGSLLYMEGDSTLHKYQMRADVLKGLAVLKAKAPKDLAKALQAGDVASMALVVPVQTFKSRESGLDSNAYKALKAEQNPGIKFELKKETLKAGPKDGAYVLTATGDLTIAGTTAPVTLKADTIVKDGKVELKGVQKLKMSDFKVTPPSISLLVTSITCTDAIEIHYDVIFAPVGEANSEAKK
ncbi:MAG TPA: YceI family protein [bacterium]|nr:YceI family protein [bacterium]